MYFLYSLTLFGIFVFAFVLWSSNQEQLLYTILQSSTLFDKVMLVDLQRFVLPLIKTGLFLSLLTNTASVLFLNSKKISIFVGESLNNIFLIFITAISVFSIINVSALISPAKFSIPDFETLVLTIRIIFGMVIILFTLSTFFFNRALHRLDEEQETDSDNENTQADSQEHISTDY